MDIIRLLTLYYQVSLDSAASLVTLYTGIAITQHWGFGSLRQKWQFAHRLAFAAVTIGWAYHAMDLVTRPEAHGLTPSNLLLHTALMVCYTIACVRIRMYQRGDSDDVYRNGDLMAGPFQ
jgi:hypothetical protein